MRPEIAAQVENFRKPALQLIKSPTPTGSWLGGWPKVSTPFEWPSDEGTPWDLVAQIRLSELPSIETDLVLPQKGTLYLFLPEELYNFKLIFSPIEDVTVEMQLPPKPPSKGLKRLFGAGKEGSKFTQRYVGFKPVRTYSDQLINGIEAEDDEELDELADLPLTVYGDEPAHHLFGYPETIQDSDVPLVAEIESNGSSINWGEVKKNPQSYSEIVSASSDWELLLQIDSDQSTGMIWMDLGRLYFMIRKQDAKAGLFDRVWMHRESS